MEAGLLQEYMRVRYGERREISLTRAQAAQALLAAGRSAEEAERALIVSWALGDRIVIGGYSVRINGNDEA